MKLKTILMTAAISAMFFSCSKQEDTKKTELAKPTVETDKFSYTIGYDIGRELQPLLQDSVELNMDYIQKGLVDALHASTDTTSISLLTKDEMTAVMQEFQAKMQARQQVKMEERKKKYEERSKTAKADGEKFLAENKSKEGVKVTKSGMQYKIIQEGKGAIPKDTDKIKLHIIGKFLDGEEFQNTYKMDMVPEIALNDVNLKGWKEALTMMPVGSKWTVFLPPALAYGEQDTGVIPPNSVVVFDIELVDILQPEAPATTK